MGNINIREAKRKEDADEIALLARNIWTEHYTPIIGPAQVEYMLERFQSGEKIYSDITESGYVYYMVYYEGKLAAYAGVKRDGTESVFLSKLYVEKGYRKKGIAGFIINHIIETYKKENCKFMWLTVNKNNINSIAAYKRLGFEIVEEMVTDIGNGFVMDDYKMKLVF